MKKYRFASEPRELIDTTEIQPWEIVLGLQLGSITEVKPTESFQDLVKYGEWMPVEGEK